MMIVGSNPPMTAPTRLQTSPIYGENRSEENHQKEVFTYQPYDDKRKGKAFSRLQRKVFVNLW